MLDVLGRTRSCCATGLSRSNTAGVPQTFLFFTCILFLAPDFWQGSGPEPFPLEGPGFSGYLDNCYVLIGVCCSDILHPRIHVCNLVLQPYNMALFDKIESHEIIDIVWIYNYLYIYMFRIKYSHKCNPVFANPPFFALLPSAAQPSSDVDSLHQDVHWHHQVFQVRRRHCEGRCAHLSSGVVHFRCRESSCNSRNGARRASVADGARDGQG